jgi:hypothetical protein
MIQIDPEDEFIGKWRLQPQRSRYEVGDPPRSGLYTISGRGERYLFEIEWQGADGQNMSTSYTATPNGRKVAYENPQIAEFVSLTRVDELTLDSESFKDGARIAHARRELLDDGQLMRVTQSGPGPQGDWFDNVAYYEKEP